MSREFPKPLPGETWEQYAHRVEDPGDRKTWLMSPELARDWCFTCKSLRRYHEPRNHR